MAYNSKSLCVLCYADRFTLWKYTTTDTGAEVLSPGYFDEAATLVRDVDMIVTAVGIGSNPQAGVLVVSKIYPRAGVTVANIGGIK